MVKPLTPETGICEWSGGCPVTSLPEFARCEVVADATGVGMPVLEILQDRQVWHVPRRDLVGTLVVDRAARAWAVAIGRWCPARGSSPMRASIQTWCWLMTAMMLKCI